MKINVDAPISDLDGKQLKDELGEVTFKTLVLRAFVTPLRGDDSASSEDRLRVFRLSQKLHAASGETEFSLEEAKCLKDRAALAFPSPMIFGRLCEALGE